MARLQHEEYQGDTFCPLCIESCDLSTRCLANCPLYGHGCLETAQQAPAFAPPSGWRFAPCRRNPSPTASNTRSPTHHRLPTPSRVSSPDLPPSQIPPVRICRKPSGGSADGGTPSFRTNKRAESAAPEESSPNRAKSSSRTRPRWIPRDQPPLATAGPLHRQTRSCWVVFPVSAKKSFSCLLMQARPDQT
jgi:hypothetical protein